MKKSRNQGLRPFSPIYKNFQHLLDHNQGIFRLFRKTKNPGMYQAVWQARQAEIDTLKERLAQIENLLIEKGKEVLKIESDWRGREILWFEQHQVLSENNKDLKKIITNKNNKIQEFKNKIHRLKEETLRGLEKEVGKWKEKSFHYREELEKYKTLTRSLNRVIDMKKSQDDKHESDLRKVQNHLNISQQALIKLDDEYEKEKEKNYLLQEKVQELESELKQSVAYAKEYRRINHRMENELYRVNNELEKAHSLLN